MRRISGFMIHIKLTILNHAVGIIIISGTRINQRIVTIDVFELQVVRCIPSRRELSTFLVKTFFV